ncbi:cytochrome b [Undibacterium oligocarboniphilum]|uniref:Cytochrome b n=1 Tax=Undibacterium oligocarboniphilum TaxID=666702 RepID=A0A850QP26_9BURK|nr:cytochrome b/b6 domain-containing protein [Undibacterium oligocarboniphilum]MBC3871678.1 cytochrome b [Undibacterium oligocarboniphilum]NVO79133.1 cytochrome b [Undibacterium oligocarboniphilum]
MNKSKSNQYDVFSRVFHWITAVMVFAAFLLGPDDFGHLIGSGIDPGTRRDIVWHETLGAGVFVMTCLRLIWVLFRPDAPHHPLPPWQHFLSRFMHIALWGLLFALPLSALMALGSESHPLTLLGGLRMNGLPWMTSSSLAEVADWGDVHKFLGDSILWLAGIHACAALYHHFRLKDDVLDSMLP